MTTTSIDTIVFAVADPSNYDEHTVANITLLSEELPDVTSLDSVTYEYLLEWA